ncbi:MAG TPA: FAD-dependent monooxygenase [Candidatus Dormibacteraeota bacterium]|jgi:2-polyprenyl-6-methoxyphenol hydroxylase-like FAD-dependent oxidoreductase|nr:FAD-dependent monooxygenase [Candidatus Dormibacteraeota bacterium]
MTTPAERVPILIAGGGYAGLTLALFLADLGVPALMVDRHPGVSIQGRARGINPRTMEIYRPLGLEAAVSGAGKPFAEDRGVAWCHTLAGDWNWIVDEDAPTSFPGSTAGEFVLADQSSVEPILVGAARRRGADLRFNTELISFDPDADPITAEIEDRATGERRAVRADYLIAADGNRSPIRERIGIGRPGPGVVRRFTSIVFDADLSDVVRRRALFWIVANPEIGSGGGGFATTATPGRWAAAVSHDPNTSDPGDASPSAYPPQRCVEVVRAMVGRPDLEVDVVDVASWEEAVGVADAFRRERVFLVGDSAHVWPPAGAMGANSAVHDAHNLAWKLAAVLKGWAGASLLDTYEDERRPVALRLANLTVRRQQARFEQGTDLEDVDDLSCILGQHYDSSAVLDAAPEPVIGSAMEQDGRPGRRAPHLWLERGGRRIATHDLFGKGFVLLTGPGGEPWRDAVNALRGRTGIPLEAYRVGRAAPAELLDVDGAWPARSGVGPEGALLVRPDGYVAWRAQDGSGATMLAHAMARVLGREVG